MTFGENTIVTASDKVAKEVHGHECIFMYMDAHADTTEDRGASTEVGNLLGQETMREKALEI